MGVSMIGHQWIFHTAWVSHLVWAVVLTIGGEPAGWCTAIHGTLRLVGNPYLLAGLYAMSSGLIIWSMARRRIDMLGFLLCVPQQFFMMSSALGALRAIAHSRFADGVERPWEFITNDQQLYLLIGVFHTAALLDVFAGEWVRSFFGVVHPQGSMKELEACVLAERDRCARIAWRMQQGQFGGGTAIGNEITNPSVKQ